MEGRCVAASGRESLVLPAGIANVVERELPRSWAARLPFWWSRILFPAGLTTKDASPAGGWRSLVLLLAVASALFFLRLKAPLLEPQEPRYAEIARQMLHEGRFLVPVLHGEDYLDKPPLLYWLIMASYGVFGVHDWAARLVPGLTGVLIVLVAYLWGRRTLGERAAFWGALLLCLSVRFVYLGRMLVMDGLLTLWVTAALALAHLALTTAPKVRRGLWLLSALACGLGMLTKGPVALVLILGPVAAFLLLEQRCARASWRDWLAYLAVAFGIALPWFVAVAVQVPGFATDFFWRHHVVRFFRPFDHQAPVWFYVPGLLLGLMPWALLLPGFVRSLARRSVRRPSAVGFFLLAFLWTFLFFSASGCKRSAYILPAFPPLAMALGWYLARLIRCTEARFAWTALRRPTLARAGALLILALGLGAVALAGSYHLLRPGLALTLAAVALLALAGVVALRSAATWPVCAAATFVVLVAGAQFLLPAYNRQFALRADLQAYAAWSDRSTVPVVCYPQRYDSVSFYLPHARVRVFTADQRPQLIDALRDHPETLLLVKSGRVLNELLDELPPTMEFVTRGKPKGAVTVGWVRNRTEPPVRMMALRSPSP
jgi:4-amino-4-deoxy-L-arabinose transferase-like glycosyltransferase